MKKPILLIIMDGIGISQSELGNAVKMANTPTLDKLMANYPMTTLKAHGEAVGLPSDDDMGNSEVGHNALGCGQIYAQGAKLVNESLKSGNIYTQKAWQDIVENCRKFNSTLHFIGLLSDGNVHSNINHLLTLMENAKKFNIKKVRIHILLDGRDVPATSALEYVEMLENKIKELNDETFEAKIASGGGRMKITMDRYQANWKMVEDGYYTHVHGIGRQATSAKEAILAIRAEKNVIDQDLDSFVIVKDSKPVGKIVDNDSVILFNFRGDRAIEISMAFDNEDFDKFDRKNKPKIIYAGMLEYDGDLHLPKRFLVSPPEIKNTLSEVLIKNNLKQFAVSETQKFGHVTYFWNGNKSGKLSEKLETYLEIPSDVVSFDERPWMKSAEITDAIISAMEKKEYDFIRCNYPNGDMVGHTGDLNATIISIEALDIALKRVIAKAKELGYTVVITADHGNADEMLEKDKKGNISPRTAHSLNPVPFIIVDDDNNYKLKQGSYGLANVAKTITDLLEIKAPDCFLESLLDK